MAPWLAQCFAGHTGPMDVEVWIEPFAGGAGGGLTALIKHEVPELWLYEAHPGLNAFWRTIAEGGGDELAERIQLIPNPTIQHFVEAREVLEQAIQGEPSVLQDRGRLAYTTLLVNRLSRSGIITPSAGPIGGWHQNGRWKIGDRFNATALAERIRALDAVRHRIRVMGDDGVTGIESLADSGLSDEVFCFVDPPYMADGDRLYTKSFGTQDHHRLARALSSCPAPWVLTYDRHDQVRNLYPEQRILEFEAVHSANRRAMDTEYLVLSDNLEVPEGNPLGRGAIRQAGA